MNADDITTAVSPLGEEISPVESHGDEFKQIVFKALGQAVRDSAVPWRVPFLLRRRIAKAKEAAMPYSNSPLNPRARKVGKRGKGETVTAKDGKGRDVELDPSKVEAYQATCDKCGSLGLYLNAGDGRNAESLHKQSKHPDTISVAKQQKRNWHGETVRDKKRGK